MAGERIDIDVRFRGADKAARDAKNVANSVESLGNAATEATQKSILLAQRLNNAASAVGTLSQELGLEAGEGAAGLLARMSKTSAAAAQLGSMLGPQGALVGGIVGAAIPAVMALVDRIREVEARNEEWAQRLREIEQQQEDARRAIERGTSAIADQSEALRTAAQRMREFIGSLSRQGLEGQAFDTAARINELTNQLAAVNDQIRQLGTVSGPQAAMRLLDLRDEAERLRREINALQADFESQRQMAQESTATRRSSSGPSRAELGEQALIDFLERERQGRESVLRVIEEQKRAERERIRVAEDYYRTLAELEHQKALDDAMREERATEERMALLDAEKRKRDALEREQIAQAEARIASYQETTGVIVGGLTDALSAIIAGEQTAGEAFQNLLSSFLAFISEQAALKAAFEAAEAIASFASQDYAGGVQHTAAAVAYGAVAVAAGAGSAALAASAQASAQPAAPEEREQTDRMGGDTIINFNSPVVTASTRAELGRDLRSLVHEADMRGL